MNAPMTPDPREANLPVWARATIRDLRSEVTRSEAVAAAFRGDNDLNTTNTVADLAPMRDLAVYPMIPLRPHANVAFLLDPYRTGWERRIEVTVDRPDDSQRRGPITIRGASRGLGQLIVRPVSTNLIAIDMEPS